MRYGMRPDKDNCICIVVTFNPDSSMLDRIKKILDNQLKILIVDNSTNDDSIDCVETIASHFNITVIRNKINCGLGAAINQGVTYSLSYNIEWCVFVDQDTEVYPTFFSALQDCVQSAEGRVAIVGSNYIDEYAGRPRYLSREGEAKKYLEKKTVITSGTIVSTKRFSEIGACREDYFIDSIDHEYCLRARSYGYKVLLSLPVTMRHNLGEQRSSSRLFRSFPEHPPFRKYYIVRNTVETIKTYWSKEPLWCVYQFIRIITEVACILFVEEEKMAKLRAVRKGLVSGIRGKMQPWMS